MTKLSFVNSDVSLFHEDRNTYINIAGVEETKGARYVGEFSVRGRREWTNMPVSVFWAAKAHPRGSNYFGLYADPGFLYNTGEWRVMICDAISVTENEWCAALNPETKEAVYSAYRHDYQTHDGLMADGGAEYFRSNAMKTLRFNIKEGHLYVIEDHTVSKC